MSLKKRITTKVCVVALAVTTVFAGCGKSDDNSDKQEMTEEAQTTDEVGEAEAEATEEAEKPTINAGTIKEAYEPLFSTGVAINSWQLADPDIIELVKKNYSSITTENEMKPDYILDHDRTLEAEDGMPVINMENVERIMKMAEDAGLKMRGHTLVWHSQTPEWLFHVDYDEDKEYADRETMLARMESYISKVLTYCSEHHPGLVYAWDVVNEAMSDDQEGGLRKKDSLWYKTIGEDYIEKAFEYAREYADKDTKLFINDYGLLADAKRDTMYEVAADLYAKGLIDGIGMQSHHDMKDFKAENLEKALFKFAQIDGIELQLTELDLHNTDNSDAGLELQAQTYKSIFDVLVDVDGKDLANVTNVTFWGLNDGCTWLTGFREETSYPLLFDANNQAKPCYYSILEAAANIE